MRRKENRVTGIRSTFIFPRSSRVTPRWCWCIYSTGSPLNAQRVCSPPRCAVEPMPFLPQSAHSPLKKLAAILIGNQHEGFQSRPTLRRRTRATTLPRRETQAATDKQQLETAERARDGATDGAAAAAAVLGCPARRGEDVERYTTAAALIDKRPTPPTQVQRPIQPTNHASLPPRLIVSRNTFRHTNDDSFVSQWFSKAADL